MTMTTEKGPPAAIAGAGIHRGLAKQLITERHVAAAEAARVTELVDGCVGPQKTVGQGRPARCDDCKHPVAEFASGRLDMNTAQRGPPRPEHRIGPSSRLTTNRAGLSRSCRTGRAGRSELLPAE